MNKKYKSFYQALTLVAFGVLLYWGLNKYKTVEHWLAVFAEIFASFVIGCIIALVLDVPMSFIERKLFGEPQLGRERGKVKNALARPVSIVLTIAGVAGIVTLVLWLLIPSVRTTAVQLYDQVPAFINRAFKLMRSNDSISKYLTRSGLSASRVNSMITSKLQDMTFISKTLGGMLDFASNTVTGVVNFLIGIVFAIYMLSQKETLKSQFRGICRAYLSEDGARGVLHVARLSKKTFSSFIAGQSTEALILGSLCAIGMSLLRLPYAATIGVLVAVTAFIPIVGAFLGIAIGAFLILITSFKQALIFVVFMVILQQIEGNLIYPKVVGKSVGLPSLWVLFAITVGGSIGGILGMFLAVPVMSVIYCLLGDSVQRRNSKKRFPVPEMQDDLSPPPDWVSGSEIVAAAPAENAETQGKKSTSRRRRSRKKKTPRQTKSAEESVPTDEK